MALAASDLARLARLLGMLGGRHDADVLHAARLSEKQVITTPEHTTATP